MRVLHKPLQTNVLGFGVEGEREMGTGGVKGGSVGKKEYEREKT